jgi:DNA-binding HxlR family transcriptional regulator
LTHHAEGRLGDKPKFEGISQKMLTQTLRHVERDGLLARREHPVVPPKAEHRLPELGLTLGAAFCGVWVWAAESLKHVERARLKFDKSAEANAAQASTARIAENNRGTGVS